MILWIAGSAGDETLDPARWHDWVASVEQALTNTEFPPIEPPKG
jgi:hypothetical protein